MYLLVLIVIFQVGVVENEEKLSREAKEEEKWRLGHEIRPFLLSRLCFARFITCIARYSEHTARSSEQLAAASSQAHRGQSPLCHPPVAGGVPLAAGEWHRGRGACFFAPSCFVSPPLAPISVLKLPYVPWQCLKLSKLIYLLLQLYLLTAYKSNSILPLCSRVAFHWVLQLPSWNE